MAHIPTCAQSLVRNACMVSISRARKMPGGGVTRSLALDAHGKSAPRCSI
jgi:hypothetical protein